MPIIICCTPDSNNGYFYGNVLIQAKNSERNLRWKWNLFSQIKDKYIPIYVSIQFVNFSLN